MSRKHAGKDWTLPDSLETWEQAQVAVLMDLRDELRELKELMRVLRCPDFLAIPRALQGTAGHPAGRNKSM